MPIQPWIRENRSYEDWIKSGSLFLVLDDYFSKNSDKVVLELGSGNSTRILAKYSKEVITLDIVEKSSIVPTCEQNNNQRFLHEALESNVISICADVLKTNFDFLLKKEIDVVLFDLGNTTEDKWLYRASYDRLKANGILNSKPVLILDNADAVLDFQEHLERDGYIIARFEDNAGQVIAYPI